MKNIYLIFSELPVRYYDNCYVNQNVHITSDEKFVKDEYITDGMEVIRVTPKLVDAQGLVNRRDWKKIILTTDVVLIKDGVRKIGEGFLKWFMDNPDCEYIEVGKTNKLIDNYADNEKDKWEVTYHIHNPDNQPKFEESTDTTIDIMLLANSMFGKKEETLEDAAEKWVFETNGHKWSNNDDTVGDNYGSFIAGAKWMKEQYTIEEQHIGHSINDSDKEYIKGFNEGSKWQMERMYSAEELKLWLVHRDVYLYNYYTTYIKSGLPLQSVEDFIKESHEYLMDRKQFKKK